jgi:hypothetical protein
MGTRKQSPATRVLADTDQTSEQRLVADADCKQQQLQFVVKKKRKRREKAAAVGEGLRGSFGHSWIFRTHATSMTSVLTLKFTKKLF